jgi:diacylglycerol kinase family enzyme
MARGTGRVSRRAWAVLALAALVLMVAGLLRVVLGSRAALLYLLVGTVLSLAILAATSWWAFTTRRAWKRRLNVTIAVLAVANVLVGLLGFGLWQAAGALAIVAGAVTYAAAARRALSPTGPRTEAGPPPELWTEAGTSNPGGLGSPSGGPSSGHRGSLAPSRPWLLVNPRSGGGRAESVGLVAAARERGVEVHVMAAGDDPAALAREAVARGADAVGVAGGDGSLGLVAAVAVEADVPFVCVPAGTRNHFAGDLGLDRADPLAALDAFAGPERRIDVGMVGDRMFVNNVSLGAYADLVADPRYRGSKLVTAHAVLPASLRGERALLQVDLGDGLDRSDVLVLLVASNRYDLNGVRERLDDGILQVSALRARTGAALASLAARLAARGGRPFTGAEDGWFQWTTTSLRVEAQVSHLPAGIDGEAATLALPLEFRLVPRALRVLLPRRLRPATGRLRLQSWSTVRRLLAVAAGPGPADPSSSRG